MNELERSVHTMKVLGSSYHAKHERAKNDLYTTDPLAVKALLEVETLYPDVWECASGLNHIVSVLEAAGYNVKSSDLVPYTERTEQVDFLSYEGTWHGDIITNPPYNIASQFVEKAWDILEEGRELFLFVKLLFVESQKRYHLFKRCPIDRIYVFADRLRCLLDGNPVKGNSAVCYAWFVWTKTKERKDYTELRWIYTPELGL